MRKRVVVVGGGPAGLMAAISAAETGADARLFERQREAGRKLAASGGGRGNVANRSRPSDLVHAYGTARKFVGPALGRFDIAALERFFQTLGIPLEAADGFHLFPARHSAADVRAAMLDRLADLGGRIHLAAPADRIRVTDGRVTGVRVNGRDVEADAVVLAAGGFACPALGGSDSGYRLAEAAGHEIVSPTPALVGLRVTEAWPSELAGVSVPDATVTVEGKAERRDGHARPLLFTHGGISGPAVLDVSATIAARLAEKKSAPLRVCLTPSVSAADWDARMDAWRREQPAKRVRILLRETFPSRLADAAARLAFGDGDPEAGRISGRGREALKSAVLRVPLTATGTDGWEKAMATRGGVSLRDIDGETLESRFARGLFFAGEVLDVDGPCGGYQLHWAFASGRLAGRRCCHPGIAIGRGGAV